MASGVSRKDVSDSALIHAHANRRLQRRYGYHPPKVQRTGAPLLNARTTRERGSMAPGLYGALIGVASFVFTKLLPQPIGSVILWAFFCAQLSWGAAICWRRR